MLRKILFLLIYWLSWVIFFEIARIFFLITTSPYAKQVSSSLKLQSLWYGLKMDLSMAAYLTILVCLFVLGALFIPFFRMGNNLHCLYRHPIATIVVYNHC